MFLNFLAWLTMLAPPLARPLSRVHAAPQKKAPGEAGAKVVIANRPGAHLHTGELSADPVNSMIAEGICKLTGQQHPRDAWLSLISPSERVGIKVNALGGKMVCTRPAVAYGVAQQMTACGIPARNILIWDRLTSELKAAGYDIQRGGDQIQCYGTDNDYESLPAISGSIGSCFSRLLTQGCDALISIPVLKDHDLAGVSLSLKSFYGAIHNPNKYHANGCDPFIADVNDHPCIKNKLRLVIIDGLTAQYNGGPAYRAQWSWPYSGLLMSCDPVAADLVGVEVIEQQRKQKGLPSLQEAGRHPVHILTAARRRPDVLDINKIVKLYI
jgi:uncharacterized protein (DUF362 family)